MRPAALAGFVNAPGLPVYWGVVIAAMASVPAAISPGAIGAIGQRPVALLLVATVSVHLVLTWPADPVALAIKVLLLVIAAGMIRRIGGIALPE